MKIGHLISRYRMLPFPSLHATINRLFLPRTSIKKKSHNFEYAILFNSNT